MTKLTKAVAAGIVGISLLTAAYPALAGHAFGDYLHRDQIPNPFYDPTRTSSVYESTFGCFKAEFYSPLFGDDYIAVSKDLARRPPQATPPGTGEIIVPSDYLVAGKPIGLVYCASGTNNLTERVDVSEDDAGLLAEILSWLIYVIASIGVWLLQLAGLLLGLVLSANRFTQHPMVQAGWPLVQGIANIGFILALLFIAFATVVGLEGLNARRLLPRLLIGALLINFSLVITGVVIDASRLVMAAFMNAFGAGDLTSIGVRILASSQLIQTYFGVDPNASVFALNLNVSDPTWNQVLGLVKATVLIYFLLLGFIVITVGLFIRYIMLILLLVVSPLAFLSIGFPGLQGMADRWWKSFLKYVIYGPVALFILVLIVQFNNGTNVFGGSQTVNASFIDTVLSLTLTVAMCIAAATVGKSVAGFGAGAAIGFFAGQSKAAAKWAGKKTVQTAAKYPHAAAAVAGGAVGGVPGAIAGWTVANVGKKATDFVRESVKQVQKKQQWGQYGQYDKAGKLKKGYVSSGQAAAQYLINPEVRAAIKATDPTSKALDIEKLVKADVRYALKEETVNAIFQADKSKMSADNYSRALSQMKLFMQDVDYVDNRMTSKQKAFALKNADTREDMLRALRRASDREAARERK